MGCLFTKKLNYNILPPCSGTCNVFLTQSLAMKSLLRNSLKMLLNVRAMKKIMTVAEAKEVYEICSTWLSIVSACLAMGDKRDYLLNVSEYGSSKKKLQ